MANRKFTSNFEKARSIQVLRFVENQGPGIDFGDQSFCEFIKQNGFTKSQIITRIEHFMELGYLSVEHMHLSIKYLLTAAGKEFLEKHASATHN